MQKINNQKGAGILVVIIAIVILMLILNNYGYTLNSIWASVKTFLGI